MNRAAQWFDAHLDLAYLARCGRDMQSPDLSTCGGPDQPAAVTLPSLREGNVRAALATIFTEADGSDLSISYPAGDAEAAHRAGVAQLDTYQQWARAGEISIGCSPSRSGPLQIGILVEGADPIRTPEELRWWREQGVVAVGLAWAKPSRYAGGNATELGLTALGRTLVREMDSMSIMHDVSHLSDAALRELLLATDRPVIASHSNCRKILTSRPLNPATPSLSLGMIQRHLTDDSIREIVRRGGVIGLNLYSPFLIPGASRNRRASVVEAIAHVEHVCALAGDRAHVGLGSDMDGGFSGSTLPEGINRPLELVRLVEELAARGWSDAEIHGFAFGNWQRFFVRHSGSAWGGEAT